MQGKHSALVGLLFLVSCGSNKQLYSSNPVNSSFGITQNVPDQPQSISLGGVARSAFDGDNIAALNVPIECAANVNIYKTGPGYREQTNQNIQGINYFSATVNLSIPTLGREGQIGYSYSGGDVDSADGALDIGFASDNINGVVRDSHGQILEGTYWRPFAKGSDMLRFDGNPIGFQNIKDDNGNIIQSQVREVDKNDSDISNGIRYRLSKDSTVNISYYFDSKGRFTATLSSKSWVKFSIDASGNMKKTEENLAYTQILIGSMQSWSKNRRTILKIMQTIATVNGFDGFSTSNQVILLPSAWNIIKIAHRSDDGKITKLMDWNSARDRKYDCAKPEDEISPNNMHSAKVSLRIKSILKFSFINPLSPKGKTGETLTNSFVIENKGPQGSMLYYDFQLPNQPRQRGQLASGKSITGDPKYTCTSVSEHASQPIKVYYSENETLKDGSKPDDLPESPANLTKYTAVPGNILFKKEIYTAYFRCNIQQSFRIASTDLYAPINKSVSSSAVLDVISDGTLPTGQYVVSVKPGGPTPTANLHAQSIVVTAKIDAVTPASPVDFNSKQLPINIQNATCGNTPGDYPFVYTITDPTGNTTATDYTVTLHCLGPQMTPPTPNPLSISANVGETATGSFSFQNNAIATPSGERAPLNFTLTSSTGLSMSGTPSPLAGSDTATVNVSYPCTSEGTFSTAVTIVSDDPSRESESEQISVACKDAGGFFEVNPSFFNMKGFIGDYAGPVKANITNTWRTEKQYFPYNFNSLEIQPTTLSIVPNSTQEIAFRHYCSPYEGGGVKKVYTDIGSSDGKGVLTHVEADVICLDGPLIVSEPLVSYHTSTTAGACGYETYNATNWQTGQQQCFASPEAAASWILPQVDNAVEIVKSRYHCDYNTCVIELSDPTESDQVWVGRNKTVTFTLKVNQ